MKKSIYTLTCTIIIAGLIGSSCDTASEKVVDAKEEVNSANQDLKEAKQDVYDEKVEQVQEEEWNTFKAETNAKIKANEASIAALKVKLKKPGKVLDPIYKERIEMLEKRNVELNNRMVNYESNQNDWTKFKTEFNKDMEELGKALKDFTTKDNK